MTDLRLRRKKYSSRHTFFSFMLGVILLLFSVSKICAAPTFNFYDLSGSTVSLTVTCDPDPTNSCDGFGNDLYIAWTGPPWVLGNNLYGPITTVSNAAPFGKLFSHTYHVGGTNCLGLVSYQGGALTPINGCWTGGGISCNAGLATCGQAIIFGGDLVGPSVSVLSPINHFTTSAPVITITGTIYDRSQNEAGYTVLSIDGHRVGDGIDRVEWTNGSQSDTAILNLIDRCDGTWIANVPLTPGYNDIRITGYDYAGNASTSIQRIVTATVTDSTPPTISISSPTSAATYTTTTPIITLSGTATDNIGVNQVTWSNDRGGTGTASGTTMWTAAGIGLQTGVNVITLTASDAAGNSSNDVLTVTYNPPDTIPPTISISVPTSAATYATTALSLPTLLGSAFDNIAVSQVTWSNDRGGSGTATGTTAWSIANLPLQPGSNIITVTARDTAGNSASDTLTVTCTPPAGAFSVTPSPSLSNVVPGLNNLVPLNYMASALGGGSFDVTSTSASLVGNSSGRVYASINTTVTIALTNGAGVGNETLTLAPKIITAAVNNRENRLLYRRTFTDGINSTVTEVPLQIVPAAAGPFSLTRLALSFKDSSTPYRITLERNSPAPQVVAELSYLGSGLLKGQWLVDGQILGFVTQQLLPGVEKVLLESPRMPPFPTYATGRHEVSFQILDPPPGFSEPTIYYDVIEGEGSAVADLIQLMTPADGASLPMSENGPYPLFNWQNLGRPVEYHFALYPGETGAEQVALVNAICTSGSYQFSRLDVLRLSYNLPYRWQVKVYEKDQLVAASLLQTVYFVAPSDSGEIKLRNLNIVPLPTQGFWHWLLSPTSAFAAEQTVDGITTFAVTEGETVLISSELVNETALSQANLRVEFVVDGKVVDASFVQSLLPGEAVTVEGIFEVPDTELHSLEIRVSEGSGAEAELLTSLSGSMVGEAATETVTKGGSTPATPEEGELRIGAFIVQVGTLSNEDPNDYAGSGSIELPFLGTSLNVEFDNLVVNAERVVTSGSIQITPPQPLEYTLAPAELLLQSLTLTPDGATCRGELEIQTPFALERIQLNFDAINIHPSNGLLGTLALANNYTIDLTGLLDGFAITINQGSTLSLGSSFNSSLAGAIKLPDGILALAEQAGLNFSNLTFNSDGGFSGTAQLNNSNIAATNLGLNGTLTLDFTTTQSPGDKAADAGWMGLYLTEGKLQLPQNPLLEQVSISNLYVDNGISGTFSGKINETFSLGSGNSAFSGALTDISIAFTNFRASNGTLSGALSGSMAVPYLDLAIATSIGISVDGLALQVALTEQKDVTLAETVTLALQEGSSVAIDGDVLKAELVTQITALGKLGGDLKGGIGVTLMIASNGDIGLKNPSGELEYWYNCDNLDVNFLEFFSLALDKVGFGFDDDQLFFGVGGGLSIMEGFKADGSATMGIFIPSGKVWANDISVAFGEANTFQFSGSVSLLDDTEWGTGFAGEMELSVVNAFKVDSHLIVGHTGNFPYFYINGSAQFPSPGLPLTPYPLAFYGFGGGGYFNMAPVAENSLEPEQERSYTPEQGSYGLMAGVTIGTSFDDGYTFNGVLGLEMNLQTGEHSGFLATLTGDAYILCNRTLPNENRKISSMAQMGCLDNSCAFTTNVEFNNFSIIDPDAALANVTGQMEIKFAEDDWYIYLGRKDNPMKVAILPLLTGDDEGIGSASGYFQVDRLGARAGYLVDIDSGKRRLLIFYGRIWGGQQADYEVSFDPMFVYAEFSVWMGLEAGVGVSGLGDFEIISAQASLNAGIRTPNPTRLWARGELRYSLLGGLVSGDWAMTFSWGEKMDVTLKDDWPCFETFSPQDAEESVNIMSPLKVVMTTPVGKKITYQDENGDDLDIAIRLDDFSVYCTTCVSSALDRQAISGDFVWNNTKTAFSFEPETFLEANQTYSILAKATAQGSILSTGTYVDETRVEFNTGDFPDNLNLMVKNSYPRNGRKYAYTGYPIQVEFNRALPILANQGIEGKLLAEDGSEVAGTYTLATDYRSLSFVPDTELAPNSYYEFKLVNVLYQGADATEEAESSTPETTATTSRPLETTVRDDLFAAQLADSLAETWLSIKFETGSYAGFKAMLEASRMNLGVTRPEVFSDADLLTLQSAPRYTVAFTTAEPFYWDELDLKVTPNTDQPTDCCRLYFDVLERPTLPNQQPVEIDVNTPTTSSYDIYSDPASGFYGADCTTTVAGLRQITRSASESISPQQISSTDSLRQALRLDVRYSTLKIVPEANDCEYDVRGWTIEINDPYATVDPVSDNCKQCLNEKLVTGSQIGLAHTSSNLSLADRWVTLDLQLPPLPTEPDAADDGGMPQVTRPELVDALPEFMQIDDSIFITPELEKPLIPNDLFGNIGDLLDELPWQDEGLDMLQDFAGLVNGYQSMVDTFDSMNFGPDLTKQYAALTQEYDALVDQYTGLADQPSNIRDVNASKLLEGFQDLNTSFQNLNDSFNDLNSGMHIF